MTAKTINRVTVPGATLHYEVTGDGPVLLLISGGGTDAAVYDGVVPQLAAQYTVVTYDPRGNSRSPLAGEPVDERIDVAAEDALAVLDAVASGDSAYVFGSSSGAITGLELLIRHPNRIRLLVAHEPPAAELLPDPEAGACVLRAQVVAVHRVPAGCGCVARVGGQARAERWGASRRRCFRRSRFWPCPSGSAGTWSRFRAGMEAMPSDRSSSRRCC